MCSSDSCKKKERERETRAHVSRAHMSGCARVINFHIKVVVSIDFSLVKMEERKEAIRSISFPKYKHFFSHLAATAVCARLETARK